VALVSDQPAVAQKEEQPHHVVLGKHQLVAILATVVDFAVMTLFKSGFGFYAYLATGVGAVAGGILSFSLGRTWIFDASDGHVGHQGLRYGLVWVGSILLNMGGEYLMVQKLGIQYFIARIPVAIAVGLLWNYPLHRYFVFPVVQPAGKQD
jgi:putative flippase GtrA